MILWLEYYFRNGLGRGMGMRIKEIIVVEGKDDSTKIHQSVDADTIETNGSAINKQTLQQIKHAQVKRGVIIFTDPDYPGKRIRHIIEQAVPGCKHAFLTRDKARSKSVRHKSLGIEHASVADIQHALADVYEVMEHTISDINKSDLFEYGLIGGANSRLRREKLGEALQIGHTNGKQLMKRLTMFEITKEQFEHAIIQVLREEEEDV